MGLGEWGWVKVYFGWVGVGEYSYGWVGLGEYGRVEVGGGIFCVVVGGWERVGAVTCFSIGRLLLI